MKIVTTLLFTTALTGTAFAQALEVDPNGNVGIGTKTPATLLHINKANYGALYLGDNGPGGFVLTKESGDNSFNIWSGAFGASENRFKITPNGNVGIGTTTPRGKLDIAGVGGLVVAGTNLDYNGYDLSWFKNTGSLLVGWNRTAAGGEVDFISNRSGGNTGGFAFYDYTNDGALNPLMTLKGDGQVGIGQCCPTY